MNLETKITIYKFTPQVFTLTRKFHQVFKLSRSFCAKNKNPLQMLCRGSL